MPSLDLPSTTRGGATPDSTGCCRRIGGHGSTEFGTVRIEGHLEHTAAYVWGDRTMRTIHRRTCGRVTHWEPLQQFRPGPGTNQSKVLTWPGSRTSARWFDGADTWRFFDESTRRPPGRRRRPRRRRGFNAMHDARPCSGDCYGRGLVPNYTLCCELRNEHGPDAQNIAPDPGSWWISPRRLRRVGRSGSGRAQGAARAEALCRARKSRVSSW